MKRNFNQPLIHLMTGLPVTNEDLVQSGVKYDEATPAPVLTMKYVAVQSLLTLFADEQDIADATFKTDLYKLAARVQHEEEVELTLEDLARIKQRVGRLFGPMIVGQVVSMLEA